MFNLRFKKNVLEFERLLDYLLDLLDTNSNRFRKEFPNIDQKYWDKILDLCENSIYRKTNSKKFTELVIKCKKLTEAYHSKIDKNNE